MSLFRALAALIVPVLVVILRPLLILGNYSATSLGLYAQGAGILLFAAGFLLGGWCILLFFNIGRGTIMPWDPTRKLVAVGPYQYVRNPMITGVIAMVAGEALFFGSTAIGILVTIFFALNHVYFIFSEEPGLEKRFGESYREYKKRVPRWIPRMNRYKSK
jgi:protein-S-isoprenylcysteine O-methyltransferase Ste14